MPTARIPTLFAAAALSAVRLVGAVPAFAFKPACCAASHSALIVVFYRFKTITNLVPKVFKPCCCGLFLFFDIHSDVLFDCPVSG